MLSPVCCSLMRGVKDEPSGSRKSKEARRTMSMSNTEAVRSPRATPVDGTSRHRGWGETRLFAKTSEFWAMLVGVAAIVVIYNVADDTSLDLWRACVLGVVLATGYIVSRGIAKSGTRSPERWDADHDRDYEYNR